MCSALLVSNVTVRNVEERRLLQHSVPRKLHVAPDYFCINTLNQRTGLHASREVILWLTVAHCSRRRARLLSLHKFCGAARGKTTSRLQNQGQANARKIISVPSYPTVSQKSNGRRGNLLKNPYSLRRPHRCFKHTASDPRDRDACAVEWARM